MRLFQWDPADAVYLPEIDAEHRAIYQSADELRQAVQAGAPPERLLEILRGLILAVGDHFGHEERLMEASHYGSFGWHKQQHETARRRLQEFADRIESGESDAAPQLLESLSDWLRDHVLVADRMAGAYLRNHSRSHPGVPRAW